MKKIIRNFFEGRSKLNFAILCILLITVGLMLSSFVSHTFFSTKLDPVYHEFKQGERVERTIQVNILNACGVKGLAAKVKEYLHSQGYDVVDIGNYPKEEETSMILDRKNDMMLAQKVALSLGIEERLIKSKADSTQFVNCTIVIGKDFPKLKPFN